MIFDCFDCWLRKIEKREIYAHSHTTGTVRTRSYRGRCTQNSIDEEDHLLSSRLLVFQRMQAVRTALLLHGEQYRYGTVLYRPEQQYVVHSSTQQVLLYRYCIGSSVIVCCCLRLRKKWKKMEKKKKRKKEKQKERNTDFN